jgi:hypothetical protein
MNIKQTLARLGMAGTLLIGGTWVSATQSADIQKSSNERTTPTTVSGKIVGIVESVSTGAGEIEIKDNQGNKQVLKVNDAPIFAKNGDVVDISQIRTGDTVTVEMGASDTVIQVAISG